MGEVGVRVAVGGRGMTAEVLLRLGVDARRGRRAELVDEDCLRIPGPKRVVGIGFVVVVGGGGGGGGRVDGAECGPCVSLGTVGQGDGVNERARALHAVHRVVEDREVLALKELLDRTEVEGLLEERDVVFDAREDVYLSMCATASASVSERRDRGQSWRRGPNAWDRRSPRTANRQCRERGRRAW